MHLKITVCTFIIEERVEVNLDVQTISFKLGLKFISIKFYFMKLKL